MKLKRVSTDDDVEKDRRRSSGSGGGSVGGKGGKGEEGGVDDDHHVNPARRNRVAAACGCICTAEAAERVAYCERSGQWGIGIWILYD